MKKVCCPLAFIAIISSLFFAQGKAVCGEADFKKISDTFANFMTCELTRIDAPDYLDKKPFKITSITVFDVQTEGDLLIVTGVVKCWVEKRYQDLYAAVGIKKVVGHDRVVHLTVRKTDFSILASGLAKFSYKSRCDWNRYRVDLE